MSAPVWPNRPILMLQGPVGGFFGHLAQACSEAGFHVLKVNLNLGDRVFQSGGETIDYRGGAAAWPEWLEALCRRERPQAIIVFGDRRPIHAVACDVADRLGIALYAFEEGYLRPNYVTFERGGNNARSPLPRDPLAYARVPLPPPARPVAPSFWSMANAAAVYFPLMALGRAFYPGYEHHRQRPLGREAAYWARNALRKMTSRRRDADIERHLVTAQSKRFFLVALQVHDDLQAVHHGRGWSQERLIEGAIATFAARAPADHMLVLRCHPLDRGHRSYGRLVARLATEHGVVGRVVLMQTGNGPRLLQHAAGMITVNSTMALSALHHGCPVYALGDSFYRIPGLVAAGEGEEGLGAFLAAPGAVDGALYHRFVQAIAGQSQVNGSFYRPEHWPAMSREVVHRLALAGIKPAVATVMSLPRPRAARQRAARYGT